MSQFDCGDPCVDPAQARSGTQPQIQLSQINLSFFRFPLLQVGIDELLP